tara:strand:- start:22 stop:1074 length:1053 start_codon:yes stop_codon:yes gene_type:complete
MNTRFAFTGATLALGLVAFIQPKDAITFAVAEGTTLNKEISTTLEFSLDDLMIEVGGQEIDPSMMMDGGDIGDASGSVELLLDITDEYLEMGKARPNKLKRTINSLNVEWEAGTGDSGSETTDELEGKAITFTWDAEKNGYSRELAEEDEDVKPEDLEMLAEDIDMRVLLPGKDVEEGDTWEVSGLAVASILLPGIDLEKATARAEEEMQEDLPVELEEFYGGLVDSMTWTCTYAGTREADGVTLQVISIESEIEQNLDFSDLLLELIESNMPGEASVDLSFVVELAGEAKGELLWNGKAGHFAAMDMEIEMVMVLNAEGSMDMQGMVQGGAIEAEASMNLTRKATASTK